MQLLLVVPVRQVAVAQQSLPVVLRPQDKRAVL
jgi:hypothetical protein